MVETLLTNTFRPPLFVFWEVLFCWVAFSSRFPCLLRCCRSACLDGGFSPSLFCFGDGRIFVFSEGWFEVLSLRACFAPHVVRSLTYLYLRQPSFSFAVKESINLTWGRL